MKNRLPSMDQKELSFGFAFIFLQLLAIPLLVTTVNVLLPQPMSVAWQNFLCFALNFLCVIAIFHRFWIEAIKELGSKSFSLLPHVLIYLGLYYAGTILINLFIVSVDPDFSNANDTNIATMSKDHYVLMAIGTVILVPPVEEILYRGVLFGQLYKNDPFLGYFVSTIAFASIHVIGYIGNVAPFRLLLCFLQYIPAGFFLARVYEKSGNIFTPILMHSIINFIGINSI